VHDFPRLPTYHSKDPRENPTHTTFSLPVLELLIKMGVPNKATGPFRDYDFSSSAGVFSIPSCQGTAEGWDQMDRAGGLVGLANAVKALAIEPGGKWRVEATGSSIGNYKPNWLSQMIGVSSLFDAVLIGTARLTGAAFTVLRRARGCPRKTLASPSSD